MVAGGQPNGYPDEIVWKFGLSTEAQARAVERGDADLTYAVQFLQPARVAMLRTTYASQLHANPYPRTDYFFLNTRVPPFDDVRVRQAVNYAVDRNRMVELAGGSNLAQPTCQVLPPNFDGYRRYCPYTIDPSPDGKYTGPDLAKARQLVAASGTQGQPVTVLILPNFAPRAAYIVSVLKSLGYKARLNVVKTFEKYLPAIADSRRKPQAGGWAWIADYASASAFFSPLLSCSSFHPAASNNGNVAEFCDPVIDAQIDRARSLQTTDPQAASQLWRKIDHDVVDQAPWIFQDNPQEADFVSRRVHNYQWSPAYGPLLDQLWVR